jgi:hypothetical protein
MAEKKDLKRIGAILLLPLAVILLPVRVTFVAPWTVQVRDHSGAPVPDIAIEESWNSYTFSMRGYDSVRSDASGLAVFPAATRWRPLGIWGTAFLVSRLNFLHGSFGTNASVRVFDDTVENEPGSLPGSRCSNLDCVNAPLTADFQIYLLSRNEESTQQYLGEREPDLQALAEDWIRRGPVAFLRIDGDTVSWGQYRIRESSDGQWEILTEDPFKTMGKVPSLHDVPLVIGKDGEGFAEWRARAESLDLYSIKRTETGGVQFRLKPGGHGLYFVPPATQAETRSYLLGLGPTGEGSFGLIKELSERWFYFTDFTPGWRTRTR